MGSPSGNPLPFSYQMLGREHSSYGELAEEYTVNTMFFKLKYFIITMPYLPIIGPFYYISSCISVLDVPRDNSSILLDSHAENVRILVIKIFQI